ncbi:predicted protein [Naegleria gruberi]|nr:uncharacterized protein NAEGRDRAFT_76505 [Naegleria gruberi]EFC35830.1 predicted protein [Naegleria gruberi]|eukprot:XP_002668574.1 predicted protein [Naegleria gruberi strain NEG-M]
MYELFFEEKPFFSNSPKIHKFSQSPHQDSLALSVPVMVVRGERPKIPWNNNEELEVWLREFIEPFEKKNSLDHETVCNVCSDYVELMKQCWNSIPSKRPSFREITQYLEKIYSKLK